MVWREEHKEMKEATGKRHEERRATEVGEIREESKLGTEGREAGQWD